MYANRKLTEKKLPGMVTGWCALRDFTHAVSACTVIISKIILFSSTVFYLLNVSLQVFNEVIKRFNSVLQSFLVVCELYFNYIIL